MGGPAKRRYDARRKRDPHRLRRERARTLVRRERRTHPTECAWCGLHGPTVFHHPDYRRPLFVVAICAVCHRAAHPRPLFKRRRKQMCEAIRTERWDEDEITELRAKLQEALRDAEAMRLANKQLLAALKRYVDKYGKLP
jgi:hypothetical protein